MASAKNVMVIIPVGHEHMHCWQRAEASALTEGVGDIQVLPDMDGHGVCYARNKAIGRAHLDDLILPLDADDYLRSGAVERMVAVWQPGTVVYGNWREAYPDGHTEDKEAPPPGMLNRKHICHATYLFAKADWERVGGYDPDFSIGAEDWAFLIALVNAGCTLVKVDGSPLYVKTMHEDGRTQKAIRHKDMIKQLLLEKYPAFFKAPV